MGKFVMIEPLEAN